MAGHPGRWLAVVAAGVAAIVLSTAAPAGPTGSILSDEDDCTTALDARSMSYDLSARCTRG